jgi:hypothetical protein
MPETTHYTGSCHCGHVRIEVDANLSTVMQCNCSICSRAGYLLTFVPPEQFKLVSGEASLKDYQFAKLNVHHLFCTDCGVRCFARGSTTDGRAMFAINVRCLDGVDTTTLNIKQVDGKSL